MVVAIIIWLDLEFYILNKLCVTFYCNRMTLSSDGKQDRRQVLLLGGVGMKFVNVRGAFTIFYAVLLALHY